MRILGIDPGTATTGYGIIDKNGNKLLPLKYGCIYTESSWPLTRRLDKIYSDLIELIEEYKPDHMAVEELFFNTNAKTAISVGHARGVILLAGQRRDLIVEGYTPLQVKQAIAGYGRADKAQVQKMVKTILSLETIPKPDDAADALAIAICHSQFYTSQIRFRSLK